MEIDSGRPGSGESTRTSAVRPRTISSTRGSCAAICGGRRSLSSWSIAASDPSDAPEDEPLRIFTAAESSPSGPKRKSTFLFRVPSS